MVFFVSCFWMAVVCSNPDISCTPIKELLTEWIVTISLSYLADNSQNNKSSLNMQLVVPYTPSGLFAAYYGKKASAWEFHSAILDIAYATYDVPSKGFRIRERKQLYTLAKAGSSKIARKIMGSILSDIIEEYIGEADIWQQAHCISNNYINEIRKATFVEFAR